MGAVLIVDELLGEVGSSCLIEFSLGGGFVFFGIFSGKRDKSERRTDLKGAEDEGCVSMLFP